MADLAASVIGCLEGSYVLRVKIRGEDVQMHHRPGNASERELLSASLERGTPVVMELDRGTPPRVRRPST